MAWKPIIIRIAGPLLGLSVVGGTVGVVSAVMPAAENPITARTAAQNSAGRIVMDMAQSATAPAAPTTPAGPGAARAATTPVEELIASRQLLMDANEAAMVMIETRKDLALPLLQAQAYQIHAGLSAFPHLFPPDSRPGTLSTAAAPKVWETFEAFYADAAAAAELAFKMSQAQDRPALDAQAKELRAACEACHAAYMHVVEPR